MTPAKMTQPKFPWALLVMLGMFAFITFSAKTPPYLQVAGVLAVLIVAAAAIYQIIPRPDDSLDHDEKPDDELPEAGTTPKPSDA